MFPSSSSSTLLARVVVIGSSCVGVCMCIVLLLFVSLSYCVILGVVSCWFPAVVVVAAAVDVD